jgi:alkylation response protein AidB-like acyl-CoA dehydrogenase
MSRSVGSVTAYVEAARNLAPQVRKLRREIETERNLPAALVEAMTAAGFLQLWRCRALSGPELDFPGFLQVVEELARADGSVGWCATVTTVWTRLSGTIGEGAGREIFGDNSRLAGSVNPTGRAVAVPGGFRVSGRWSYGSFIAHSHWTVGNSIVHNGDAPRRDAQGAPDIRFMIFPTAEVEIIDNWRVSGLRGTGSCDFQVVDLFVPEEHAVSAFAVEPVQPGALYRMPPITLFAAAPPCVSVGIARAAIDAFTELAEGKTPMGASSRLREKPMTQADLGRAEALLRSGRAFLIEAIEEIWQEAEAGGVPSLRQRAIARLAAAKAAEASAQAVDLLYNAAGGTALFENNSIERCFRDVHATTQHIGTQAVNYELAGCVLLGLDPGTPRF